MLDLPPEMLREGRDPDPYFADDECLYRRVMPEAWADLIAAITLPDMSVNREKYSKPHWVLLVEGCETWGIISFRAGDVPAELQHLGMWRFTFRTEHVPLKHNYSHSEVRSYEGVIHIDLKKKDLLPPELFLRWRNQLLCKVRRVQEPATIG